MGLGTNGDWIASPAPDMDRIGFICHEAIEPGEAAEFIEVARSFERFFYDFWHLEGYPCDDWGAVTAAKDDTG